MDLRRAYPFYPQGKTKSKTKVGEKKLCLWGREEGLLADYGKSDGHAGVGERTLLDYLIPSYFFP